MHRRGGKTVGAVFDGFYHLCNVPLHAPRVAYIAPFQNQAVRISWTYIKSLAGQRADLFKINKSNHIIEHHANNGELLVLGADKADALRGMYLDLAILDELADMPMSMIEEVIRPCVADREGRILAIGTPRGTVNSLYELHTLDSPDWDHFTLPWWETGMLPVSEIIALKREMTPERFRQEFECDFMAQREGVIYAREMNELIRSGRRRYVPYSDELDLWVILDLGYADATAVLVVQPIAKREYRVIESREYTFTALVDILEELRRDLPPVDRWIGPHDLDQHELTSGTSRYDAACEMGIFFDVAPKVSVEDGIDAGRMALKHAVIDTEKAETIYKALMNYQYEEDKVRRVFKQKPLHNWASHTADAWRYFALVAHDASFKLPLTGAHGAQDGRGYRRIDHAA